MAQNEIWWFGKPPVCCRDFQWEIYHTFSSFTPHTKLPFSPPACHLAKPRSNLLTSRPRDLSHVTKPQPRAADLGCRYWSEGFWRCWEPWGKNWSGRLTTHFPQGRGTEGAWPQKLMGKRGERKASKWMILMLKLKNKKYTVTPPHAYKSKINFFWYPVLSSKLKLMLWRQQMHWLTRIYHVNLLRCLLVHTKNPLGTNKVYCYVTTHNSAS